MFISVDPARDNVRQVKQYVKGTHLRAVASRSSIGPDN